MAIQARWYSENLEFPFIDNPSNGWMGDMGGFDDSCLFDLQRQPSQQKQQYQQQQKSQEFYFDNGFLTPPKGNGGGDVVDRAMSMISQRVVVEMQKQNQEIDRFIASQNERLRLALQEQQRQQLATLLRTYELKSQILLRQKDEEMAKASRRAMELQELLLRTEMEKQGWQKAANENETMAVHLNHMLERLNCVGGGGGREAEDAESCCETDEGGGGNGGGDTRRVCKSCFSGDSCVVFLPCRHLCACTACDAVLETCPVCATAKKASIHVLI